MVLGTVASNLITVDTNGKKDVFPVDRQIGQTQRISTRLDDTQLALSTATMSADGNRIAYSYNDDANYPPRRAVTLEFDQDQRSIRRNRQQIDPPTEVGAFLLPDQHPIGRDLTISSSIAAGAYARWAVVAGRRRWSR